MSYEKLLPPLVPRLRREVKTWRDSGYVGATETSRSLLNYWFNTPHLVPKADGKDAEFCYYFAQREALETIVYLYDVAGVQDKYDLMRFDSSGAVSTGMFDESWRRFVIKMADRVRQNQSAESGIGVEFLSQAVRGRFRPLPKLSSDCAEYHRVGSHPQGFRRAAHLFCGPSAAGEWCRWAELAE